MKTVLCFCFLALTELSSAFVIHSSLEKIEDLLTFLNECGHDRTCIKILSSADSICGDWSQFRRCMSIAICPDYVMNSIGEQIKEIMDPNCTEMAADGQACHKVQDVYSCLMNVPKRMVDLCMDLWPISKECFVDSGCPETLQLDYKNFLDWTTKKCEMENVRPTSASRTSSETPPGEYQTDTDAFFNYTTEEPRKTLHREYQNGTEDVLVYTTEQPSETTHEMPQNEREIIFGNDTEEPRDSKTTVTDKSPHALPKKLYLFKMQGFIQSSYSVWNVNSERNFPDESITDGQSFN